MKEGRKEGMKEGREEGRKKEGRKKEPLQTWSAQRAGTAFTGRVAGVARRVRRAQGNKRV